METYTIGFLGHHNYAKRICGYMDTLIVRALQQYSQVRVMLTLWRQDDRLMAGRVLEIEKFYPGLRLILVITEQEERVYKKNSPSPTAGKRKRLIDAADGCEVVPDIISSNRLACYHRKFIECCDQIVYATFRVPLYVRDDFARQVRALKGKQPLVRYVAPGEFIADPINLDSMFDLRRSIEYIRRSGFRVLTDKLPQDMLEKWLDNADLPQNYMEFGVLEEAAEVFSRKDTWREHYLLYKVFTAAYIVCRHLLTDPDSTVCKEINSRFRQFRRMLELLAEHRRKGIDIGRFDLLDFDNYDEIFNQFGWEDRLEKSVTRLCDSEPGSNLFSTNGQTE